MKKAYVVCETCKSPFEAKQKEINRGNAKYCSLTCSARRSREAREPNCSCAQCNKAIYITPHRKTSTKSGLHFCSQECKNIAQRIGGILVIDHYKNGISSYREICFRTHGTVCVGCGYDKHRDVLTAHHRDHDRSNNKPENLVPLCPTCHVEVHHGHRELVDQSGVEPAKPPCKGDSLPATQARVFNATTLRVAAPLTERAPEGVMVDLLDTASRQ